MKTKYKEGVLRSFYIDNESVRLLEHLSRELNMSKSETICFLIKNYYLNKDIESKLKQLQLQAEKIEKERAKLIEQLEQRKKLEEQIEIEKERAINILTRKISTGASFLELESVARFWAVRLRTTVEELLFKASIRVKKNDGGVTR